ncbi:MAG: hypothetical protein V4565_05340 [Bacteroidota bacterium]
MKNKSLLDYLTLSVILGLVGLVIFVAGIYFEMTDQISSGVTMGRFGNRYGTGIINGKGMTCIGIMFMGFGYVMRDKKPKEKKDER